VPFTLTFHEVLRYSVQVRKHDRKEFILCVATSLRPSMQKLRDVGHQFDPVRFEYKRRAEITGTLRRVYAPNVLSDAAILG
jgi:hypothetical protein